MEPSTTTRFDQLDSAVWPDPAPGDRFDGPLVLVASFAKDYLAMDGALVGDFNQGDSRSGEVEIRSLASSNEITTVLVRQLGPDDDWFVIGSVSGGIVVDQPLVLAEIARPIVVSGLTNVALDGELVVELRAHGGTQPLTAQSMSITSGSPVPFRFELAWASDAEGAQIVLTTSAANSETLVSASVTSVRLG